MIDVYQAATQMTDESGQAYPFTPNTLLDNALGPLGYYGAFMANMHTDLATTVAGRRAAGLGAGPRRADDHRPAAAHLDRRPQRLLVHRHHLEQHDSGVQRGGRARGRTGSPACCPRSVPAARC